MRGSLKTERLMSCGVTGSTIHSLGFSVLGDGMISTGLTGAGGNSSNLVVHWMEVTAPYQLGGGFLS